MGKDWVMFVDDGLEEGGGRRDGLEVMRLAGDLPWRILLSFLPPLRAARAVYVDWLGPTVALLCLAAILQVGHANKHPSSLPSTAPLLALVYYTLGMPTLCLALARIAHAHLTPSKILSLIGYSLYGHVATLLVTQMSDHENDTLFFLAMFFFGGLSTLRVILVFLLTISRPPARLLICSYVSISNLLFLVYIHFAYMHRTFVYGTNS